MLGTLLGRARARVDSALRQQYINNARWFIFNKGRSVVSQAFTVLKEYSWHPIRVRNTGIIEIQDNDMAYSRLECILRSSGKTRIQLLFYVCP